MSSTLAVAEGPLTEAAPASKPRTILYWVITAFFALPTIVAGSFYIGRSELVLENLGRLGYPAHFAGVLGAAKVLGAIVLLAPRLPRLKEWAYAGFTINLVTALVAHAAAGDRLSQSIPAAGALVALGASWWLRPATRRL
jgi:uncharacterized membrane protein YphA (DoxX/SURF4 family)